MANTISRSRPSPAPRTVGEAARGVLAILAEGGTHTPASLAGRMGVDLPLVSLALEALAVSGKFEDISEKCRPVPEGSAASACAACGMPAGCGAVLDSAAGGRRVLRRASEFRQPPDG